MLRDITQVYVDCLEVVMKRETKPLNNLSFCPDGYIYCGVFLRPIATKLSPEYYIRQPAYDEHGNELDSDHFAVYKKYNDELDIISDSYEKFNKNYNRVLFNMYLPDE